MSDMINNKELFKKLERLQWLLHRQHQQLHAARGPFADPTRGQGRVLAILKMQPEISTKDLSYLLDIRQQSLSELLNKLEKAGYITRTPKETDRRVMIVKLTEKGREARQEPPDSPDLFDCLSEEEQNAFSSYLSRIISNLETMLGTDDREDMEQWMEQARSRMGDDAFEHLMAMRSRSFSRSRSDRTRSEREERPGRGRRPGRSDETRR